MRELKDVADMLAKKELSRKQFLSMVGGSFVGMISGFQVLQSINTPINKDDDLATSNRQVFGEREYGHPGPEKINQAKKAQARRFDEDVFG